MKFKQVPLGAHFTYNGKRYKKTSHKAALPLLSPTPGLEAFCIINPDPEQEVEDVSEIVSPPSAAESPAQSVPLNQPTDDPVNPSHYGGHENPYEAIKVIDAWNLDFCLGNAVKYISRAGKKQGNSAAQDLSKAIWYIRHEIETLQQS